MEPTSLSLGLWAPQWHAIFQERSRASKPNGAQLNGRDDSKRERENTSRRTWPDDGDSLTSTQFDLTFFSRFASSEL